MIKFPPIESFYTDDDKAIIARKADLAAKGKQLQAELTALNATILAHGDNKPTPDEQIQNLIAGIDVAQPQPLDAKRTELRYIIKDIEQGLDYMAGQERLVTIRAGKRLAAAIKPDVDKAEKEAADAIVIAHEKHLTVWQAKRHLINSGTGLNGLFDSNIDEVLGIPVDKLSPLHDYFHAAQRAGHLRAVPAALR